MAERFTAEDIKAAAAWASVTLDELVTKVAAYEETLDGELPALPEDQERVARQYLNLLREARAGRLSSGQQQPGAKA